MAKKTVNFKTTQEVIEKEVARTPTARPEEEVSKELVQLVVFELDEEEYAVDISEVREILRIPEITPIPNSPDFIEGIINVRGGIVVVLDLEERFNLTRDAKKKSLHVVLAEIGDSTFGAIVDAVTEVLRVPKDSIEQAPAIISEKIRADYVKGIVVLENRLLILLDFKKVFEEKGLIELGELVTRQAKAVRARHAEEKPEEEEEGKGEAKRKARVEEFAEEFVEKATGEEPKEEKPTTKSVEGDAGKPPVAEAIGDKAEEKATTKAEE